LAFFSPHTEILLTIFNGYIITEFTIFHIKAERMPKLNTELVRTLLNEKGLTQRELAKRWGVADSTLSQVLNNKRPRSLLRGRLARTLGVRLGALLEEAA
jgi:antitoxin component HigA of HigAB toxin-antitoxin module